MRVFVPVIVLSALLASCAAGCAASCAPRGGTVALSTDPALMPRLESIVASSPLPRGWSLSRKAEGKKASIRISLEEGPGGPSAGEEKTVCGFAYRVAAVDLSDSRYSVSPDEAKSIGLVRLESIRPPLRVLSVDGLWPGEKGYPFSQPLLLTASREGGGRIPRLITAWLDEAARSAAAIETRPGILSAAGDIQVGEPQYGFLLGGEAGLESLMGRTVLDRLRSADIAVANLEAPVSSRGEPNPRKRFHFRMPPGSSAGLHAAGFDLLLFGNNHAFDYGPDAFADTLGDLASAGMPMVGAGRDSDEAAQAVSVHSGALDAAFVGFAFFPDESLGFSSSEAAAGARSPGISTDESEALASVRKAAASGAFVVLLAHGGTEYVEKPSASTRRLYARFVDAGADLVIGTHPHLLQGCEARAGSLIAYSLGNFIFTSEREPEAAWKTAILEFLIYNGKVRGLRLFPVLAGYDGSVEDPDRGERENRFSMLCAGLESGSSVK
jgi:hypothetical protein